MAALELALLLLATVLASAILDQLLPRVSLPLIQIALGVAVGLLSREQINITLNPELFLVLFIAPLLFHEAREANNLKLWENRFSMLSYAIGLVIAIVLAVGFATHLMIPSIPLAAAFALGAALGPTDPIAVASIGQQADIPERQSVILKGESLLNDASGIVSFQFAVAAVVTGSFSVADAVQEFVVEFFGALVVGVVLGVVLVKFIDLVRGMGLENTTFHVSLELITPFMAYLLGEAIGVSGIILVVACGITMSFVPRDLGPASARMSIVSTSVWQVITFALNGIVFVLLGTQLPQSFMGLWLDEGISNFHLVAYVVVITVLMHAIRFIWSLVSDAFALRGEEPLGIGGRLRSAAITTLSGSKGAITLAIMFSLPFYINSGTSIGEFPQRNLLIFLACGVILMSLLLATFIVPLLAPRKREEASAIKERDAQARADILRSVVEELTARQTPENRRAMGQVISRYNERIERVKEKSDIDDESDMDELRLKVLGWEQDFVLYLIENDEVPPIEGYQYLSRISHIKTMLKHGQQRRLDAVSWWRRFKLVVRKLWVNFRRKMPGKDPVSDPSRRAMRDIQARAALHVIERLQDEMAESDIPSEQMSALSMEYRNTLSLLRGPAPSVTAIARNAEVDLEATRMGLRIELEQIQQAYEERRISRTGAQKMRENVYLMQIDLEDYV